MPKKKVCVFHVNADKTLADELGKALRALDVDVSTTTVEEGFRPPVPGLALPTVILWTAAAQSYYGEISSLMRWLPYLFAFVIERGAVYENVPGKFYPVDEHDDTWVGETAAAIFSFSFGPKGLLDKQYYEGRMVEPVEQGIIVGSLGPSLQTEDDPATEDAAAPPPASGREPAAETGLVLWNMPKRMLAGRQERVEIRLGDANVAEAALRKGLRGRGDPQVDTLTISHLMRVTLVADEADFRIKPLNNLDQVVERDRVACWDFLATPLRAGRRTLRILISIRLKVEGRDEVFDLPSYERDVHVAVAPVFITARFVSRNWQWIVVTVVIPLIAWVAADPRRAANLVRTLAAYL